VREEEAPELVMRARRSWLASSGEAPPPLLKTVHVRRGCGAPLVLLARPSLSFGAPDLAFPGIGGVCKEDEGSNFFFGKFFAFFFRLCFFA
jgi:hypothetical protein